MPDLPTFTTFFGDGDRRFALPAEMIIELERVTGAGIGTVCKRLFAGQFHHADILATIRLALIGGGETPQIAASLVATYAANRPLAETYPLAVSILETAWFGRVQPVEFKEAAE